MNLKNNQITLREILNNPSAKALLDKKFPRVLGHPLAAPAQTLTLAQLIEFARIYVSQTTIGEVLQELKKL